MFYRLRRFWESVNKTTLICALLLIGIGWGLVFSATLPPAQETLQPIPSYAARQAVWIALAVVAIFLGASIDYHVLVRLAPWIYGGAVLLLALVLGTGHTSFGARRWFTLGSVFMQPGEFTKVSVLLMVARYSASAPQRLDYYPRTGWPKWVAGCLLIVGVPMALIAGQPNLGTASLLLISVLAIWVVMGVPWSYLAAMGSVMLGSLPFLWAFLKSYQRARILNFLNPYRDPLGGGYTVIQSTMAIGSGGLLGRGYLEGPQNRLEYIPKHHTDFIASVLGEEFGWVGCAAVMILYMFLYMEGLRIAHRARELTGTYLAVGIVALLAFQTLVNMGMSVGIVPISGLPLPFLSYGGSSLLINAWLVGILLNIGRQYRR